MEVVVLNGLDPNQPENSKFLDIISKSFVFNYFDCEIIDLHAKRIQPCRGCFKCWVQTPGRCFINDDSQHINQLIINCELLVFLTPIIYGGYSSHLKIMLDRIIPLISPFFGKYAGETHHKPRYGKYPSLLGIGIQNYSSEEEAKCFNQMVYRNSLNLHSPIYQTETFLRSDDESNIKSKLNEIALKMEELIYAK